MIHTRTAFFAVLFLLLASAAESAASELVVPDGLKDCATIFNGIGVPSGQDGADETDYTFANGQVPASPNPHYFYKCYGGGFAVRLNAITKVPDWTAEDITPEESQGTADRSDDFFEDKALPTGFSSLLTDYKGSGFDRGHQVPAGDFAGDQALMDLTFVMSNMGPQVGRCFNQGIWRDLEAGVRDLIKTRQRLIAFTGPIYGDVLTTISDVKKEKPGVNVAVPTAFYKIIYSPTDGRVTTMKISNEKHCKQSFRSTEFLSSVDETEEITGFDFFPGLTDRKQQLLESQTNPFWSW